MDVNELTAFKHGLVTDSAEVYGLILVSALGGPRLNEADSPPALESLELNSRFLFQSISFFAFMPSVVCCFHHHSALGTHSPALFHKPLQSVSLSEVGMRLTVRWLDSHMRKNLTTVVTSTVLGRKQRRRR